jgi:hypothetical protein
MSNDMNFNLIGVDKVTPAAEKATQSLDNLSQKADRAGKRVGKTGRTATKDWAGLGDLFSGLLPRGLSRTLRQFKSTQRSVSRLSKGFKGLKSAIASTGIGLLVVALGAIVGYWDDISAAINSASDETDKLVEENKELVQAAKDQLEAISATENILKLQGATEEEILSMRMAATDEAIAAQRIMIDSLKQQKKEQAEAAQTASDVVAGILTLITAPIAAALVAIDAISEGLVKIGALDEATNLAEGFYSGIGDMLFDPEGIEEDGQKAIDEAEEQLQRLENTRAGYQLRANKNEEQAEAAAQKKRDDAARKREQDAQFVADRLVKIQEEMYLAMIEDDIMQQKERRRLQYEADQAELKARGATFSQLLVLKQQYDMDVEALDQQALDRRNAKEKERLDKEAQLAEEFRQKDLTDKQLEEEAAFAEFERQEELAGTNDALLLEAFEAYQLQKDAIAEKYNQKEIDENQEVIDLEIQGRQALAKGVSGVFKQMGRLAEQNSQEQKTLAVADVLLNQAIAMANAVRGASETAKDPISLGVLITTMVGGVLSSFASIKGILDQAGTSGGSVGGGSTGQTRSGFNTQSTAPLPSRLETAGNVQAYVVQSQLEGQTIQSEQLAAKTTL